MNSAYIIIYYGNYLIYVSGDVMDIISNDQHLIYNLKSQYQEVYDTYYEKID